MRGRHLIPAYLLDHFDHVAHGGPLIRRSRCTRQSNLKQAHHLILDILISHELQIEYLSRPFLSHHRLDPPRQIHHSAAVHGGGTLPGEDLQEDHAERVHVGLVGASPTVQCFGSAVAVGSGSDSGCGTRKDGEPKICHACVSRLVEEDVGRFDVTVGKIKGLARVVNEGYATCRSRCYFEPCGPVQWGPPRSSITCRRSHNNYPIKFHPITKLPLPFKIFYDNL